MNCSGLILVCAVALATPCAQAQDTTSQAHEPDTFSESVSTFDQRRAFLLSDEVASRYPSLAVAFLAADENDRKLWTDAAQYLNARLNLRLDPGPYFRCGVYLGGRTSSNGQFALVQGSNLDAPGTAQYVVDTQGNVVKVDGRWAADISDEGILAEVVQERDSLKVRFTTAEGVERGQTAWLHFTPRNAVFRRFIHDVVFFLSPDRFVLSRGVSGPDRTDTGVWAFSTSGAVQWYRQLDGFTPGGYTVDGTRGFTFDGYLGDPIRVTDTPPPCVRAAIDSSGGVVRKECD